MLDSSEIIRIERGKLDLSEYLGGLPADAFLAAVTVSEMAVGALLADSTSRRDARLRFLDDVLTIATVIPFGEAEARVHAELRVALRHAGETVGAADLMIAATAIAGEHDLLTQNVREFQRVPGLRLIAG